MYLGVNKYSDGIDRLNQVYNVVGPFNLRDNMGEQHIILDKNMTDFFKEGKKIRVCYFLVNKLHPINKDNFIPSQYFNLKDSCGQYYFHELE